ARGDEPEGPDRLRRRVPEEGRDEPDRRRPDDPAGCVPGEEAPGVHVRQPCAPGGDDPQGGDEATEEDGLAAVPGEEALAPREILLRVSARQPVAQEERPPAGPRR